MKKLESILSCVEFCARQGIPLRGHRELDFSPDPDHMLQRNPGNFLALVRFRSLAGDISLRRDFHQSSQSRGYQTTYLSPRIQNELIKYMGDELREKLLEEVRAAPCFAVLADEAADHSNQEVLSLVLRFVDRLGEIQEVVVDFLMCNKGVSGEALADMILSALQSYQLDLSRLRGQGYDGAGNMAGRLNGCAVLITRKWSKVLYVHCNAHCLNLCGSCYQNFIG